MSTAVLNPACRNRCHIDRGSPTGFVIEPGCPMHDRAGYQPFRVSWINGQAGCLGALTVSAEDRHLHTVFFLGLN